MFHSVPSRADVPLMQDPAFATALRACGQVPVTLRGGLTLLHRRIAGVPLAMLPRAVPPDELAAQLRAVGLHRTPLILSPERACAVPRAVRLRPAARRAELDLSCSKDLRRAALHGKWRNQLVKAERAGLRVDHGALPPDPHHPVLLAEVAQARGRRYQNWPLPLTVAFAAAAPAQTRLFTAFQGRKPVAHMLFLRHGDAATYHIGHISAEGRALCAHNLLLWMASDWLAAQGCTRLDLGLLDPRHASLDRFKLRSGAHVVATGGTWLRWHPLA